MKTAYIGIGGNLGDRAETLRRSVVVLGQEVGIRVVAASAVYETAPVGLIQQPDFLNAVLEVETSLSGPDLLDRLLGVEKRFGRCRKEKWGPRTLDLDVLLYGDAVIQVSGLEVPHPQLYRRGFVLVPLCDLFPDGRHPVLRETFANLLKKIGSEAAVRRVERMTLLSGSK